MIFNKSIAKKTAEVLLQINAIKLTPRDPFTWASSHDLALVSGTISNL